MIESGKLLDKWLPPEGVGQPIGCIATSFTFEPDFFEGECLSRFLGFDGVRGETSELSYVIEEEERLAETSVTAIVDRSQNPGNRNLRWDLLAVSPPRGLMHAKVTLLAWEKLVRFLVSSANLTRPAYRSNVEVAVTLDASDGSDIPRSIFDDLLAALDRILALAPEAPGAQVPVTRARETMARVERLLDGFELRATPPRGAPKLAVIVGGPGQPVLPQLDAVWSGPVPRDATVLSPYFDTTEDANRVGQELAGRLAKSGRADRLVRAPRGPALREDDRPSARNDHERDAPRRRDVLPSLPRRSAG